MNVDTINNLLDEKGEVQLYMDSGAKFEIHREARISETEIYFEDEDGEEFYLDTKKVEYVSAHRSHRSSPA